MTIKPKLARETPTTEKMDAQLAELFLTVKTKNRSGASDSQDTRPLRANHKFSNKLCLYYKKNEHGADECWKK